MGSDVSLPTPLAHPPCPYASPTTTTQAHHRILWDSLAAWHATASTYRRAKDLLSRVMHRGLATAWAAWCAAAAASRDAQAGAADMLGRWQRRELAAAFGGWLGVCVRRGAAQQMAVRYLLGLMDWWVRRLVADGWVVGGWLARWWLGCWGQRVALCVWGGGGRAGRAV